MMKNILFFSATVSVIALTAAPTAHADNPVAGYEKAKAVCASCHGEDGNSASSAFPKLAGQNADYLVKALRDYKSGARKNPVMSGFAASLSLKEMQDVAAWYASQSGLRLKY